MFFPKIITSLEDGHQYHHLLGKLIYFTLISLDIIYIVNQLIYFMQAKASWLVGSITILWISQAS